MPSIPPWKGQQKFNDWVGEMVTYGDLILGLSQYGTIVLDCIVWCLLQSSIPKLSQNNTVALKGYLIAQYPSKSQLKTTAAKTGMLL